MSDDKKKLLKQQYKKFLSQQRYTAAIPDQNNLTRWHLTFRGPKDTPFEDGYYHLEFDLSEYPQKAPNVTAINNNGSFNVGEALCIVGLTHYHNEAWLNCDIIDLLSTVQFWFANDKDRSGIGVITDIASKSAVARIKELATQSKNFVCPHCKQRLGDLKISE